MVGDKVLLKPVYSCPLPSEKIKGGAIIFWEEAAPVQYYGSPVKATFRLVWFHDNLRLADSFLSFI